MKLPKLSTTSKMRKSNSYHHSLCRALKMLGLQRFLFVDKLTILGILGRVSYFKCRFFFISPPLYATPGFGQSYSISWPYTKMCIYNQFSKFKSFEFILIHWKLIFLIFNHLDVIHLWGFTTSLGKYISKEFWDCHFQTWCC